jgi:hypothetical protein
MILALRRARDGEPDRPTPLWGAISIGAAVGFVSGLTGVGGGVSRALIDRLAMGVPETDGRAFRAIHIGEFGRRACRCYVRWIDPCC